MWYSCGTRHITKPGVLMVIWFLASIALAEAGQVEDLHVDALSENPELTLRQVLDKTFVRNPQQPVLQAKDADVSARSIRAKGMLPGAPAIWVNHQNDAIGSGRGEREWQGEVELPLWLPGQKSARQEVAYVAQTELYATREALLLQSSGQLREAVWDIRMNENLLQLAESRSKTAKALQHDVERRFQAGELAKTDVMLAQNEVLVAETAKLRAEAELMHARHRYSVLTGLHEIPAQCEEQQSSLEGISDSHPLWKEAETRIALAEGEKGLAQAERRENLQLLINARSQRGPFDEQYNDSIGFKLRIPFDSEIRSAPMLAAAEANIGRALSERESLRYQLETSMHEAEHNLNVTQAELKIVGKQNELAQENFRLAQKAFQLGETDLVNFLRVQALAYEAERALNSRRIQLKWDVARYNQAVGVLP